MTDEGCSDRSHRTTGRAGAASRSRERDAAGTRPGGARRTMVTLSLGILRVRSKDFRACLHAVRIFFTSLCRFLLGGA